jgi:dynein light chain LC8-type
MSERKAVIKNADMSEDMQQDAVDCASQALEKFNIEKVSSVHCYILFQCCN